MRTISSSLLCVVLACSALIAITGCKTDEPGVKSTYRSQWTTVAGNTAKATEAAKDVLEDLKLQRIDSKSTGLDGYAVGYTADNKKITVDVKKVTDETSEVSVNVGTMGDPDMGKDIIARIQRELK
jgi:hypothetical protein